MRVCTTFRLVLGFLLISGLACARGPSTVPRAEGEAPTEAPPLGKLPTDVRPLHYALDLEIVPERETFSGRVAIRARLDRPRSTIWMHGRGLRVTRAEVRTEGRTVPARFERASETGVAALRVEEPIGPGEIEIHLDYEAPFNRQLEGLYRVDVGGRSYAFTQFEPISARLAFPSFDEPVFKTPFDVTLIARSGEVVLANTPVLTREDVGGGMVRHRFATTKPLPTYLLAWAIGPLEVVEGSALPPNAVRSEPIPFRGVAVAGQGAQLAYALEHTAPLLESLERYFGTPYPFEKLDIVAVPDFAAGAMENPGLITFRDSLLLLRPDAPEWQRRAFASVMAHELAHQWFGNLVTMPWWDDLWLNEAFATWMGERTIADVHPDHGAELTFLAEVHAAMDADSLESARAVRQPIESDHDIQNAFDSITYLKGGGLLAMFERWLGPDVWQNAIRQHMETYAFRTATADDLLATLSEVSGRDVREPFRTFLDRPGVPLVRTHLRCDAGGATLELEQTRYLPLGASGTRERRWQIPVCVRYGSVGGAKERCTLLEDATSALALDADRCPTWVHPNADAAGYYRFSLSDEQRAALRKGREDVLTAREELALGDSLSAAFDAGELGATPLLESLAPFATSKERRLAELPMESLRFLESRALEGPPREQLRVDARALYRPVWGRLGWHAKPRETGDDRLLRGSVLAFLTGVAKDPALRREAVQHARVALEMAPSEVRPIDPNLLDTVLAVGVEDGGPAIYDRVEARFFASHDPISRSRMLRALGHAQTSETSARALALTFDARLRTNEALTPLRIQLAREETRAWAIAWLETHFEALQKRISPSDAGELPWFFLPTCSRDGAARVRTIFEGIIERLPGGPRNLAAAIEAIELCAKRAEWGRKTFRSP